MAKNLVELNSETLEEALDSAVPVAVDFYADWCAPCAMVAPIIDELAQEYRGKVIFARLNIDENPEIANRYEVMSIPTLIVFTKGKAIKRIVGARKIDSYRSEVEEVLASS